MKEARLLYGTTFPGQENLSTDLLWRTGFLAPDPFFAIDFGNDGTVLLVSDLEYGRAKKESRGGCSIELLGPFIQRAKDRGEEASATAGVAEFLRDNSVSKITLHAHTPAFLYPKLLDMGFDVSIWDPNKSFYPQREVKSPEELERISDVQRITEEVVFEVMELLRRATISADGMLRDRRGRLVTAESIRSFMDVRFAQRNCLVASTIIACGDQAVDPHCVGYGPLYAKLPIVLDVYPRSKEHWYWSDMSRTFFKGEPTEEARNMYQTVLDAQFMAIGMIHAGVNG